MEKEIILAIVAMTFSSLGIGFSIANFVLVSKMEKMYKRSDDDERL